MNIVFSSAAAALTVLCFTSGPGDVPHRDIPAQLGQGGGAAGRHALRGAGQSSHRRWIRTLQQPHGLQHQPPQYGPPPSLLLYSLFLTICCYSFLNECSRSVVFMTALISSHYTCSTGHSLIPQVVVLALFTRACLRVLRPRWPSEVGAGPAASHHWLGLRGSGGHCCLGGYRRCLP